MYSNQDGFDSIDYLVAYDYKIHDNQKYLSSIPKDDALRIQPDTSSYAAYRSKHNLALVGEQILMDGVPRYDYAYSAVNSRDIQPKATGKLGQYYFDGGLVESPEEIIQKELENCLFNIKKKMRRNEARSKGFDIIEKERDLGRIDNELYENVVFEDIFDKPNQNYRRVFYAPDLNEQEVIPNNEGYELDYINDIEDFRHIQKVQEENIESKLKKQGILSRLNVDIMKHIEQEEMKERERIFQMSKNQKKGGIMRRKGDQRVKKTLKFDDSVLDKNEMSADEYESQQTDGYGKQLEDGKVKMSFKEFMNAHTNVGKRQTQSAKYFSNNDKILPNQDMVGSDNDQEETYDPTDMPKKIPRWKMQSEAIRASMKTNQGYSKEENEMIITALNKTDLVYCEYCKRKFKPGVADQHIPSCKEKFEEKQRQFQFQQKKRNSKSSSKF